MLSCFLSTLLLTLRRKLLLDVQVPSGTTACSRDLHRLWVSQDHHGSCADCPGVLCHPWAGTLRMCLSEHTVPQPCCACVSLCSMSCSSTVMLLSPFKAKQTAFKIEVPSQKDLLSYLAPWRLSSFPAVQRSLATGAATGLGKTGKKKSLVKEKN